MVREIVYHAQSVNRNSWYKLLFISELLGLLCQGQNVKVITFISMAQFDFFIGLYATLLFHFYNNENLGNGKIITISITVVKIKQEPMSNTTN